MFLTRRNFFHSILGFMTLSCIPTGVIQAGETPLTLEEGKHWRRLHRVTTDHESAAVEILEFFSYGCPHCGRFNPVLKTWVEQLPDDVTFRRIPVTFNRAAWENLARLYYALEHIGELQRLDQEVFHAVSDQRKALYRDKVLQEWLEKQNVNIAQFNDAFNGFAVEAQLARDATYIERYHIDAVPTLTIGPYAVINTSAKSYAELLEIADQLIVMARSA
jgi:thiol:disulfide interchange protein DsbA